MGSKNISVIVTTYNGSKYIKKQLDSIFNQTLLPAEIIICDDKSTDDTVSILNSYADNSLVNIITNETQLGSVQNFKKAAKLTQKGNWLVFADQDDIWMPQKLKKLADAMQLLDDSIKPALIYSDLAIIDKNDTVISTSFWAKQRIYPHKINPARLLYGNVVTGCTMIINYAMAEEFFVMDNYTYLHDEWLAFIAYSFGTVSFLDEKLVLYRQHENNITFSEGYEAQAEKDDLKTNVDYLTGKKAFLSHQFKLAQSFLNQYGNRLDDKQTRIIKKFIKQKDKNYLLQRINRYLTFL
jgi:glycosyltransferase involved in cell wall biosynthesis